ncbi:tRNA (adenosine(37)-N6)-threonylcarbamoyltransferase complex ATPase subunit type 1 TsaE [Candidatus Kaiserbacteria bacterium]|nr:tRNA (adenosine(37)-N6)-threonylcarbamoyltransferase complex ATPase subunit type 1 TsaE [Candidatus Kaiserbacteria bacterium]
MRTLGLTAFKAEAADFAVRLKRGKAATVVALSGGLGAGKTAFTQVLARSLGVDETVASPTFVIQKVYQLPDTNGAGFKRLIHIDAHRIDKAHELEVLGWKEIAADPDNVIVVEWPEHAQKLIPADAYRVKIEYIDEFAREITYTHGKKN